MNDWKRVIDARIRDLRRYQDADPASLGLCTVWVAICDEDTCTDCESRDGLLIINERQLRKIERYHRCTNSYDGCRCSLDLLKLQEHRNWKSMRKRQAKEQEVPTRRSRSGTTRGGQQRHWLIRLLVGLWRIVGWILQGIWALLRPGLRWVGRKLKEYDTE